MLARAWALLALALTTLVHHSGALSHSTKAVGRAIPIKKIGSYQTGAPIDAGGVEILAFDPSTNLVAAVDASSEPGITVIDVSDPSNPTETRKISFKNEAVGANVGTPNNVAIYKSIAMVAAANVNVTNDGFAAFFNISDGSKLALVQVADCPLPDELAFSDDGMKVYLACEGEKNSGALGPLEDGAINPPGAIGVVDVTYNSNGMLQSASFNKSISIQTYIDSLSGSEYEQLRSKGFIIDPRVSKSQAALVIEPEYIALGGGKVFVALQENNAIAVVDSISQEVTDIWPLGLKDWSDKLFDASDKDGGINRRQWPNLRGIYQPDAIIYHEIHGKGYLFTANEGDAKDNYETVAGSLTVEQMDPVAFPNWDELRKDENLGRLEINPFCGLKHGYNTSKGTGEQGPYTAICAYGARSFSILDATTGEMVFDSGDDLEDQIETEARLLMDEGEPACFNCDNTNNEFDARSIAKGGEPESIDVMTLRGRSYAFVGLERQSSVVVYEVTNPRNPAFISYYNDRNYSSSLEPFTPDNVPELGLVGPEMVKYVPASMSPNGKPLLFVSGEVGGTLAVLELDLTPGNSMNGSNRKISPGMPTHANPHPRHS